MRSVDADFGSILSGSWFERDAPIVGRDLLNKILVSHVSGADVVAGRIIEVEAYTENDPASHTFCGRTSRNAVMFDAAGRLYVYLSYGIHHCANVVTGPLGQGQAVLLRAVEPLAGLKKIRLRRGNKPDQELVNGPGKVCQAFAIDLSDYGTDLTDPASCVVVVDDGTPPPASPLIGPRVGISRGVDTPWRFRVAA
jgi:DNA-3-methyladenine glycosylase